jgi:hypothetical protein
MPLMCTSPGRIRPRSSVWLLLALAASTSAGNDAIPTQQELSQNRPALAGSDASGFVVVWESFTGSVDEVHARRYDVAGVSVGAAFPVSAADASSHAEPAVAMSAGGRFVVAWQRLVSPGERDIRARIYDHEGLPVGAELQVSSFADGYPSGAAAAMGTDGGFVVAWQSAGQDGDGDAVVLRRFDSAGAALGTELVVNTTTTGNQGKPSLAALPDGGVVVAWHGARPGEADGRFGIFAQSFDSAGQRVGSELHVSPSTPGNQLFPSVAADSDGGFIIAWQEDPSVSGRYDIFAQRHDSAGAPAGAVLSVNAYTAGRQRHPRVAVDADGNFAVAWQSEGQDGSDEAVVARQYASTGAPMGAELVVNTFTLRDQERPSIAFRGSELLLVWESMDQDGSGDGVFGTLTTAPAGDTPTPTATAPAGDTPTPTATAPAGDTPTPTATAPAGETATPTATAPAGETATPTVSPSPGAAEVSSAARGSVPLAAMLLISLLALLRIRIMRKLEERQG